MAETAQRNIRLTDYDQELLGWITEQRGTGNGSATVRVLIREEARRLGREAGTPPPPKQVGRPRKKS